jgi:hypothetical protein
MKRSYTIFISIGLLLVVLASSSCNLMNGGKIVARKMVTKEDAEKIFGGIRMRLVSERMNEHESACVYLHEASDIYVEATFQTFPSEEHLKASEELAKTVKSKYGKIESVEGIGDGAWLENDDFSQTLHVRRGNIAFFINATGNSVSDYKASLQELQRVAKSVAARL